MVSLGQSYAFSPRFDLRLETLLATDIPGHQSHHELAASLGAYF
jgi:hypothetical protein